MANSRDSNPIKTADNAKTFADFSTLFRFSNSNFLHAVTLARPICLLALGSALAVAQSPVPTPPGVPIPGSTPSGTAGAPDAVVVQENLGNTKITEDITEPKLSGTALAGLYRKYTGRRVIVTAAASTAEFSFVQEASPSDPLTYAQAAELLKKAATVEDFIFVPDASDPNLDILTIASTGLKPATRGLKVYTENDELPEGDAVISYVMKLSYIKPEQVVQTFKEIVGQFGSYGTIAPVPNASSVVITDNTSLIRKLVDLKKEIDKPSSQVATRFIKVQYADVTELATTLSEMLTSKQTTPRTAGVQRAENNAPPNGQQGAAEGGSGEDTPVQIVPDPRTNRIFAMGRPVDLLFVEALVREFDTQTDQKNFLRRKLRFLKVSEFLPVAGDALTRAFSGTGTPAAGGGAQAQSGQQNRNTQQTNNNANRQSQSTNRNFGGSSGGGSTGGSSSGVSSLGDPDATTAPESLLVGRTLLVADNITNSIVVQGPPAGVEIVEKLLDQIDVRADQVMISCVFGQLSLTDGWSFGVDYVSTLGKVGAGRAGSGAGPAIPLGTTTPFNPGSLAASAGLGLYGSIGNNLNIYLNAKQEDSNFKVLSRPTIYTANNQKGTIVSGTQIAVPTSSYASSTSTTNSTNYEYKDVALKLEVIPLVNSTKEVTLQIYLTSDDIGTNRPVGTGDNQYLIPDILKRELVTTVTVPNNQTIVLGGLITENLKDGRTGIPVLSRIPGIGALFGSKTKSKDRSELLIFIQPSVVHDDATLSEAQADMDRRYETSGDTRNFADGPGVLPPPDGIVPANDKASSYAATPAAETPPVKTKRKPVRVGNR